jgi:hypothetical protein
MEHRTEVRCQRIDDSRQIAADSGQEKEILSTE